MIEIGDPILCKQNVIANDVFDNNGWRVDKLDDNDELLGQLWRDENSDDEICINIFNESNDTFDRTIKHKKQIQIHAGNKIITLTEDEVAAIFYKMEALYRGLSL